MCAILSAYKPAQFMMCPALMKPDEVRRPFLSGRTNRQFRAKVTPAVRKSFSKLARTSTGLTLDVDGDIGRFYKF